MYELRETPENRSQPSAERKEERLLPLSASLFYVHGVRFDESDSRLGLGDSEFTKMREAGGHDREGVCLVEDSDDHFLRATPLQWTAFVCSPQDFFCVCSKNGQRVRSPGCICMECAISRRRLWVLS